MGSPLLQRFPIGAVYTVSLGSRHVYAASPPHILGTARIGVMKKVLLAAIFSFVLVCLFSVSATGQPGAQSAGPVASADGKPASHRLLYVATPGIRNYLQYGGHGLLVFDMDNGHRLVKRIPTGGYDKQGQPLNVKGIAASARTGRVYVSTTETLQCFDLLTEKVLWEKAYEGGTDRMA